MPEESAAAVSRAAAEVEVTTRSIVSPGRHAGISENDSARCRTTIFPAP